MKKLYLLLPLISLIVISTSCGIKFRKGDHEPVAEFCAKEENRLDSRCKMPDFCEIEENKSKPECFQVNFCDLEENKSKDQCTKINRCDLEENRLDPACNALIRFCEDPKNATHPDCTDQLFVPPVDESKATPVAPSFLGFSQEWPWVVDMTQSEQFFSIARLLKNDANGPLVLRVGGAAGDVAYDQSMQEGTAERSGIDRMWNDLVKFKDNGFKFVITVNLANRDSSLAKTQADQARQVLGSSLLSIEIGNEPNYYKDQKPELWPNNQSNNFYRDIVTEFANHADVIGCNQDCMGPAWGWIGLKSDMMENYFKTVGASKFNFVSVHYYKSANRDVQLFPNHINDTPETLLDESYFKNEVVEKWVKSQVDKAAEFGKKVRFSEANSISGGGNEGVSNVYAAALWTLDTSLDLAAEGVAGIDFHQGSHFYAMYRRITKLGAVSGSGLEEYPEYHNYKVQAPFYGMRFFQQAIGKNAKIAKVSSKSSENNGNLKVYQIYVDNELRTVVVNKDYTSSQKINLVLPVSTAAATGDLILMTAPGNNIRAKTGITIAGINYDGWGGAASGTYTAQAVKGQQTSEAGFEVFSFTVPPASAAMLTLKK